MRRTALLACVQCTTHTVPTGGFSPCLVSTAWQSQVERSAVLNTPRMHVYIIRKAASREQMNKVALRRSPSVLLMPTLHSLRRGSPPLYAHHSLSVRYANRAKNIKNKPKINEDPKDAMLRQYKVFFYRIELLEQTRLDHDDEEQRFISLTHAASQPHPTSGCFFLL